LFSLGQRPQSFFFCEHLYGALVFIDWIVFLYPCRTSRAPLFRLFYIRILLISEDERGALFSEKSKVQKKTRIYSFFDFGQLHNFKTRDDDDDDARER